MDQLHDALDKLFSESDHLSRVTEAIDEGEPRPEQVDLALSVAKKVRRESTIVVRRLASLRDELQP